jgi:hypothetical protein
MATLQELKDKLAATQSNLVKDMIKAEIQKLELIER